MIITVLMSVRLGIRKYRAPGNWAQKKGALSRAFWLRETRSAGRKAQILQMGGNGPRRGVRPESTRGEAFRTPPATANSLSRRGRGAVIWRNFGEYFPFSPYEFPRPLLQCPSLRQQARPAERPGPGRHL